MKLLLVEDEVAMSEALVDILQFHHYAVDTVYDGEEAFAYARDGGYDAIIMDIMMPKMDGLSVLQALRARKVSTPVLLLTAKSEMEDKIHGLDLGADDYLTKPFAMGELLARVRALLRRREEYAPDVLRCGNVTLDTRNCVLTGPGNTFELSKLEYQLLELFMRNPDVSFSSEKLLERVWGYDAAVEIGTVWVYISYLRKKLGALGADVQIRSKRNIGYALEVRK